MKPYVGHRVDRVVSVTEIFTVHYYELTKDFDYPAEAHDFWELHYIDRGHVFCYSGDRRHELSQGDLLFYKPGVTHRLTADGAAPANVLVLSFACRSGKAHCIQDEVYTLGEREKQLISLMLEEAGRTFDLDRFHPELKQLHKKSETPPGSLQLLASALEHLMILLIRRSLRQQPPGNMAPARYDDGTVNAVIDYLAAHVRDRVRLSDVAEKIGYGTTFLCTRFKQVTGKSVMRVFTEMQMQYAKYLLREDREMTVSALSDLLHYSEPAYFCSVFKKVTGMSPKEYARTVHAFDTLGKQTDA